MALTSFCAYTTPLLPLPGPADSDKIPTDDGDRGDEDENDRSKEPSKEKERRTRVLLYNVNVGNYVQWTSQGVDQFQTAPPRYACGGRICLRPWQLDWNTNGGAHRRRSSCSAATCYPKVPKADNEPGPCDRYQSADF